MTLSSSVREGAPMSSSDAMRSLLTGSTTLTFNVNIGTRFEALMTDEEAKAKDTAMAKELATYAPPRVMRC